MKRFLAPFVLFLAALLAPAIASAVPLCTLVGVGSGSFGTGTVTPSVHASTATGDLLLYFVAAVTTTETSDVDPSGYTLLQAGDTNNLEVWGKIATSSETGPSSSMSGSSRTGAFIVTLHSSTGWPAIGSILAHSGNGASTATGIRYRSLTITTDNTCAIQFGYKGETTGATNVASSLAVTSGFSAASPSTIAESVNSAIVVGAQFQSQTTATSLSTNDVVITSNTDSTTSKGISLSLAMSAATAPTFSVSPAIGTRTTSSIPVTATTACTDCMMYGVEQTAGNSAPSVTQIKAGQNGAGSAAFKTCSVSPTANVQATCTFSSITDGTVKDQYFALNSTADGDIAAAATIANAYKLPAFTAGPTFSTAGTGGATYSVTLDGAGTIYGVACKAGSTAATVTQVEAGQCTGGAAAQAAANTSGSSLVIGTTLTLPIYDFDIVGTYGSQHEAAIHADTNRLLTAPSTCGGNGSTACQYITIASIGTGSPCESFNTATSPDIAASDILKAPITTHAGSYALTVGTNCQFSYTGDTSRQDALNIAVYDYSAQAYHADDIDFWANNLPPVAAYTDSLTFHYQVGRALIPVPLALYCPDPEGDTVTVTAVSGLISGLSIVANSIVGTPTVGGTSILVLRCTDTPGDSVDWQ